MSIEPLGTNFGDIKNKNTKHFIHENAYENIVFEMAAILSRERWVKLCMHAIGTRRNVYVIIMAKSSSLVSQHVVILPTFVAAENFR